MLQECHGWVLWPGLGKTGQAEASFTSLWRPRWVGGASGLGQGMKELGPDMFRKPEFLILIQ